MKNILFCLTALFLFQIHYAQNSVRLYSADGSLFKIYIQDKLYNKTAQASVLIENLKQDTLYLKAEFENKPKLGLSVYLLDKGKKTQWKEFDYMISITNNKIKITFTGIYDYMTLPNPLVPDEPQKDTSSKYLNSTLSHFCELKNGHITYFNNLPMSGNCTKPMPEDYLSYTRFLLSKTPLSNEKSLIAEDVCRNNCLTVEQLNSLLPYVEFEIDRLRILHFAYFNLVDTLHKNTLLKNFNLKSSINEITHFFANSQNYRTLKSGACVNATDTKTMSHYVSLIASCNSDYARLDFLRKTFNNNCYSTLQINQILKEFVHEREKLEAAKLLYLNCVEKEKYSDIINIFVYTENKINLTNFIEKQHH